jgi:hypothetical protein
VEVHDARAQQVAAGDHGVRDECLTATLQPIEQRAVEGIEMRFDLRLAKPAAKIAWHVAERRDAQLLCGELQFLVPANRVGHRPR